VYVADGDNALGRLDVTDGVGRAWTLRVDASFEVSRYGDGERKGDGCGGAGGSQ